TSEVKVFSGSDLSLVSDFFAYDLTFNGGVRVAAADITGDGKADIITAPGSGTSNVKVFDAVTLAPLRSFDAYPGFSGGVFVAGTDVPEPASILPAIVLLWAARGRRRITL